MIRSLCTQAPRRIGEFTKCGAGSQPGHTRLFDRQPIGCITSNVSLDDVFRGLADANRRKLLDRLHDAGGQTLSELCDGMGMARQSVSKHLAILESANLVVTTRRGREKLHYLNPVPIAEMYDRWIGKYERDRMSALVQLRQEVEGFDD
jgi:DNA-binding transcriptional ArsR family regulator